MSRRVLIAGCGYVGSALAGLLSEQGHRVWGLRRFSAPLPAGVSPVLADLGDREALHGALPAEPFDWVVCCAAADARDPDAYRRAYVDGIASLLEVVAPPSRLLLTSSTAVYGQRGGEWVDEESETVPNAFNGAIMLEAEALIRHGGADEAISLRLGGIYGPGRGRVIELVKSGRAHRPPSPNYTNRIHRDDCAGAAAHLLTLPEPEGIYLGVDHEPADLGEVYDWLAGELGVELARGDTSSVDASSGKRCNNLRLRESGYAFRYPTFREGYRAMLDDPA